MVHVRGSAHHDASGAGTSRPDTFDRWRRLFRGQESELRHLRRWLTGLLPDCPERDDLISVAVELGTNAVQHTASGAGGWFTVAVTRRATVVRLDVDRRGRPVQPAGRWRPDERLRPRPGHRARARRELRCPWRPPRPDRLGRDCVGPGRCAGTRRGACPQRLPGAQNPPHPPGRLPQGQRFLTGRTLMARRPGPSRRVLAICTVSPRPFPPPAAQFPPPAAQMP